MNIEKTRNTPLVELNKSAKHLYFEGESRPEDVRSFYIPIIEWIDSELLKEIIDEEDAEVVADFKLEYFNSASAKYILDIVEHIKGLRKQTPDLAVTINWYYDELDDDMLDAGKEFSMLAELDFEFHATDL